MIEESRRIKKHGKYGTKTYTAWANMWARCTNHRHEQYPNYGGRGIAVDEAWSDFAKFYKDMGDCPKNRSIDRIDVNKGYSAANCRWATSQEQCRNKRNNRVIVFNGEEKCVKEWAEVLGIKRATLSYRIDSGWPLEIALDPQSHTFGKKVKKKAA